MFTWQANRKPSAEMKVTRCIEGENIHACSAENWFDLLPPEKKTASAKHAGSQGAKDAKDEKAAATDTKSSKASSKPEAAVKGDERYGEDDPRYALVKEEVQPSAEVTEKQARHQADVDAITASNAAAMEEAAAKHQKDIDTIAARNAAATEAAAPTAAATVHPNQVKNARLSPYPYPYP